MIHGIVGVVLWTERVEELVRFYRDGVGLPLHSHHGDFAAFDLGPNQRLSVGRHSEVRGPARDPYRVMVHLGADDIHSEYQRMHAAGVEFVRAPERERWGGWVATFRDPDGNVLQLLQGPER